MLFNRTASIIIGKEGGTGKELSGLRVLFLDSEGINEVAQ